MPAARNPSLRAAALARPPRRGERILEEVLAKLKSRSRLKNEDCDHWSAHGGQDLLFTILTGVTQESRVGSTAVRTGVAKCRRPCGRSRLSSISRRKSPSRPSNNRCARHLEGDPARSRLSRQPARGRRFAHVLRVFQDETVPHEHGSVDPARDFDDVETELILSDLVVVEKRLERMDKDRKKIGSQLDKEYELLVRCKMRSKPILRCVISKFDSEERSAFAASSFCRRSRCCCAESGRRRRRRASTKWKRSYRPARSPERPTRQ